MKKLFTGILILGAVAMAATAAAPQPAKKAEPQAPDFEQIKADVTNPASPYYYPKLMERYERNETIMNLNDYGIFITATSFRKISTHTGTTTFSPATKRYTTRTSIPAPSSTQSSPTQKRR